MVLRKCKCGKEARDESELELFAKSNSCNFGRRNLCKQCMSKSVRKSQGIIEPAYKLAKGTYTTGKGQVIWQRYGLSELSYKELLDSVDNRCEICGDSNRLCIDHSHSNGNVRGVLCGKCNTAIGMLGDELETLLKAVAYLSKSQS